MSDQHTKRQIATYDNPNDNPNTKRDRMLDHKSGKPKTYGQEDPNHGPSAGFLMFETCRHRQIVSANSREFLAA